MDNKIKEFCLKMEKKIQAAYEETITIPEAEKLAAEFLHAELVIAQALQRASLDSRMRKQGLKAIKAAVYLEGATKTDKKPSDVLLGAQVDVNEIVASEQAAFDTAEVETELLQTHLKVFSEAHVFFRQISKSNG